ncbi:hypothetical protein DACRYDRAFT_110944 [Dacryopinax primogenitus]|uniref:Uncharacterized protein n=1 Tax=Dacryopinax primogenitus (strain DJM 731) TaxID=1858805 RepID=M5FPE8_DACPD|nr:uncharacterized protein DACRYDRAFT_110944 [Dacryopinax primogenitus]EJT98500.1 hypothetical protein DACRYDRAFT_110944 [Dacryopinax primogenitus]
MSAQIDLTLDVLLKHEAEGRGRIPTIQHYIKTQKQFAQIYAAEGLEEYAKWSNPEQVPSSVPSITPRSPLLAARIDRQSHEAPVPKDDGERPVTSIPDIQPSAARADSRYPSTPPAKHKCQRLRRHYTPDEEHDRRLTERRERRRAKAAIRQNKFTGISPRVPNETIKKSEVTRKRKKETEPLSFEEKEDISSTDEVGQMNVRQKCRKKKQKVGPVAIGLLNSLAPSNIRRDRITLQPPSTLGVFNKGKASAKVMVKEKTGKKTRGRSIVFSETKFLGKRHLSPAFSSSSSEAPRHPMKQVSNYFAFPGKETQAPPRPAVSERSSSSIVSAWSRSSLGKRTAYINNIRSNAQCELSTSPRLTIPLPETRSSNLIEAARNSDSGPPSTTPPPAQESQLAISDPASNPSMENARLTSDAQLPILFSSNDQPAVPFAPSSTSCETLDMLIAACADPVLPITHLAPPAPDTMFGTIAPDLLGQNTNRFLHHSTSDAVLISEPSDCDLHVTNALSDYSPLDDGEVFDNPMPLSSEDCTVDPLDFLDQESGHASEVGLCLLYDTCAEQCYQPELQHDHLQPHISLPSHGYTSNQPEELMPSIDDPYNPALLATRDSYPESSEFVSGAVSGEHWSLYDDHCYPQNTGLSSGYHSSYETDSDTEEYSSDILDDFTVGRTLLETGPMPAKMDMDWNADRPLWPRYRV